MRTIKAQHRLCVICEGCEEFQYLKRLKELGVWSDICSIKLINVGSIDNIAPRYQYEFSQIGYDLIFVFCDTETAPYEQFKRMKEKIDNLYQKGKASDKLVIFANPCTMQIVLSHFEKVRLRSNSKSANGRLIERLTGIAEYRAKTGQLDAISKLLTKENYDEMKENLSDTATELEIVPSTNFLQFVERLESNDAKWVNKTKRGCGV